MLLTQLGSHYLLNSLCQGVVTLPVPSENHSHMVLKPRPRASDYFKDCPVDFAERNMVLGNFSGKHYNFLSNFENLFYQSFFSSSCRKLFQSEFKASDPEAGLNPG